MTSCIHFIRHGITEGVKKHWYYGMADLPLIPEGEEQILALKEKNIYPSPEGAEFYTSGMLRANQTLKLIYGDVPFTEIPEFKEMNFGNWECKTLEELQMEPEYDEWSEDIYGLFEYPGGGDSAQSFFERVNRGADKLLGYHRLKELSHRHNGKDTVSIVACHGGVTAACMTHLVSKTLTDFWKWLPEPGHGYSVYFENGQFVRYEKF